MTQEQKIKEFVDKWVGKHGFVGIFHNYRKDCIQDLTNLLDNWINVEDELPKATDDSKVYSDIVYGHSVYTKGIAVMYYDYHKKEWIAGQYGKGVTKLNDNKIYWKVTHWKTIYFPKPPKDK